jgi:hypothetical protein
MRVANLDWTRPALRGARRIRDTCSLHHATTLSRASGSGSEGWKTRSGRLLEKWTTCSPSRSLAISRMTPVVGRTSIAERRRRRLTVGRPSCSLVLKLRPLGSRCINRPTKRALRDALLFCSLGLKERPREGGLGRFCGAVGLCEGRHAAPGGTPEGSVTETGEAKEHHSPDRWLGHTGHAILRPVIRGLLRRRPPEIGFLVAQAIRSGPKRLSRVRAFRQTGRDAPPMRRTSGTR